jgi:hypothetical protein
MFKRKIGGIKVITLCLYDRCFVVVVCAPLVVYM